LVGEEGALVPAEGANVLLRREEGFPQGGRELIGGAEQDLDGDAMGPLEVVQRSGKIFHGPPSLVAQSRHQGCHFGGHRAFCGRGRSDTALEVTQRNPFFLISR